MLIARHIAEDYAKSTTCFKKTKKTSKSLKKCTKMDFNFFKSHKLS